MPNEAQPNPDPRGDAPEIGGDRGDPIAQHRIGPMDPKVSPAAPVEAQADSPAPAMGEGEKYWYDKAQALEEENAKLAQLGQYADVIAYLDTNQDAVNLVIGHMKGEKPSNDDYINEFDRDLGQPEQLPNGGTHTAPKSEPTRQPNLSEVHRELRAQYDTLLKEKGIPEHDKDRFIKFLMDPSNLTPEEVFGMFSHVDGIRKGTGDNAQNPQGQTTGSPMQSNPDVPPMSIAGINGGSDDPLIAAEAAARAQTRIAIDPNNL